MEAHDPAPERVRDPELQGGDCGHHEHGEEQARRRNAEHTDVEGVREDGRGAHDEGESEEAAARGREAPEHHPTQAPRSAQAADDETAEDRAHSRRRHERTEARAFRPHQIGEDRHELEEGAAEESRRPGERDQHCEEATVENETKRLDEGARRRAFRSGAGADVEDAEHREHARGAGERRQEEHPRVPEGDRDAAERGITMRVPCHTMAFIATALIRRSLATRLGRRAASRAIPDRR